MTQINSENRNPQAPIAGYDRICQLHEHAPRDPVARSLIRAWSEEQQLTARQWALTGSIIRDNPIPGRTVALAPAPSLRSKPDENGKFPSRNGALQAARAIKRAEYRRWAIRDRDREIERRYREDGLKISDLSRTFKLSRPTIYAAIKRARLGIKALLEDRRKRPRKWALDTSYWITSAMIESVKHAILKALECQPKPPPAPIQIDKSQMRGANCRVFTAMMRWCRLDSVQILSNSIVRGAVMIHANRTEPGMRPSEIRKIAASVCRKRRRWVVA